MRGVFENLMKRVKEFSNNVIYVLRVCKKPEEEEIYEYTKVVLIGILILGFLGFLIFLIFSRVVV